jgi:hypothetical protein
MAIKSIKTGSHGRSLKSGNSIIMPGDFESISTQYVSSDTTSVTFSSIPNTFTHLQLRYNARKTTSGITDLIMTFNGESGNASKHWVFSFDGAGPYISAVSNGSISLGYLYGDDSGVMSSGIIDILEYKSTAKYKTAKYFSGNDKNSGGTANLVYGSGMWMNTSAINSITLSCSTIKAGSHFALYGIRG